VSFTASRVPLWFNFSSNIEDPYLSKFGTLELAGEFFSFLLLSTESSTFFPGNFTPFFIQFLEIGLKITLFFKKKLETNIENFNQCDRFCVC